MFDPQCAMLKLAGTPRRMRSPTGPDRPGAAPIAKVTWQPKGKPPIRAASTTAHRGAARRDGQVERIA